MTYPTRVRVVEVGPRDGLQNEPSTVPAEAKVALIEALADAGLTSTEAGIDLRALAEAGRSISRLLNREPASKSGTCDGRSAAGFVLIRPLAPASHHAPKASM